MISREFSFIQISDHHLRESEAMLTSGYSTAYAFRSLMRHIAENAAHQADFIVTTGDITETPSDESYRAVQRMLGLHSGMAAVAAPGPQPVSIEGLSRFPMYFLPGNHDDRRNFFDYLRLQPLPSSLANTGFQHKGVQFVCLDWGAGNQAVATPEMLSFLEKAVKEEGPSILLMHHQVVPVGVGWMDDLISQDIEKFWNIVRGRSILGIFCGHLHETYETIVEGVAVYGLRSTAPQFVFQDEPLLCLQPLHYRIVRVASSGLTTEVVEVAL